MNTDKQGKSAPILVIGPPKKKPTTGLSASPKGAPFPSLPLGPGPVSEPKPSRVVGGTPPGPVSEPKPSRVVGGQVQGQLISFPINDWYHPTYALRHRDPAVHVSPAAELVSLSKSTTLELVKEPTFAMSVKTLKEHATFSPADYAAMGPFNIGHRELMKQCRSREVCDGAFPERGFVDANVSPELYQQLTGKPLPAKIPNTEIYPNSDWMAYNSPYYPVEAGVHHDDDADYVAHLIESSYPQGTPFGYDPNPSLRQAKSRDFIDYLFRLLDRNGNGEEGARKVLARMDVNSDLGLGLSRRNELKNILAQGFIYQSRVADWLKYSDEWRQMVSSYVTAPYYAPRDKRPADWNGFKEFGPYEYDVYSVVTAPALPDYITLAEYKAGNMTGFDDVFTIRSWMYGVPTVVGAKGTVMTKTINPCGVKDLLEYYHRTNNDTIKFGLSAIVGINEIYGPGGWVRDKDDFKIKGTPLANAVNGVYLEYVGIGEELYNSLSVLEDGRVVIKFGEKTTPMGSLGELVTILQLIRGRYLEGSRAAWGPAQVVWVDRVLEKIRQATQL